MEIGRALQYTVEWHETALQGEAYFAQHRLQFCSREAIVIKGTERRRNEVKVPVTVAKLLMARTIDDDDTTGTEYTVGLGKGNPVTIKLTFLT